MDQANIIDQQNSVDTEDTISNEREVINLARLAERSQNSYERLESERAARILRDPHSSMNRGRLSTINRHFVSRILPHVQSRFRHYMTNNWVDTFEGEVFSGLYRIHSSVLNLIDGLRVEVNLSERVEVVNEVDEVHLPRPSGVMIDDTVDVDPSLIQIIPRNLLSTPEPTLEEQINTHLVAINEGAMELSFNRNLILILQEVSVLSSARELIFVDVSDYWSEHNELSAEEHSAVVHSAGEDIHSAIRIDGSVNVDIEADISELSIEEESEDEEEEEIRFSFDDEAILVTARRVIQKLKLHLLEEIISVSSEALEMGVGEEERNELNREQVDWLEEHKHSIVLGEIDLRNLNLSSLNINISAYIILHNKIIERSRELLTHDRNCSAISAYRNFDFSLPVRGDHANPFDPSDSEHAFYPAEGGHGQNNEQAAHHVQVLTAFYYLGATDPAHEDTNHLCWANTVGQLADIRNTYGSEQVSCYLGTVGRISGFVDSYPLLQLPITLLTFVRNSMRRILANAVYEHFQGITGSDYETRRNTYLSLLTFSSFNASAICSNEMTSVMNAELSLLSFYREDFTRLRLPGDLESVLSQIQAMALEEYPDEELGLLENALVRAMYHNLSSYAAIAIRSNYFSSLSPDERHIFDSEEEADSPDFIIQELATTTSEIFDVYSRRVEELNSALDLEHSEFSDANTAYLYYRDNLHLPALEYAISRANEFGVPAMLVAQEIRDTRLTFSYLNTANRYMELRQHNQDLCDWSDDDINIRIINSVNGNYDSLWFNCAGASTLADGVVSSPTSDTLLTDSTGETLQQAVRRLHLQERYVEEHEANIEEIPNNVGVVNLARRIQVANQTYVNRNREANISAGRDENSIAGNRLIITITHFNNVVLPYLADSFRQYMRADWLALINDEDLAAAYRFHQGLIDYLGMQAEPNEHTVFHEDEDLYTFILNMQTRSGRDDVRSSSATVRRELSLDEDGVERTERQSHTYTSDDITSIRAEIIRLSGSINPINQEQIDHSLALTDDVQGTFTYSAQHIVETANRIIFKIRVKLLNSMIAESGSSSSLIDAELGAWLRENKNIIIMGPISTDNLGPSSFPEEIRAYIQVHNSIVGESNLRLNAIRCDLVSAWSNFDFSTDVIGAYANPFDLNVDDSSLERNSYYRSNVSGMNAPTHSIAVYQCRAMLALVYLSVEDGGQYEDVSNIRWASVVGQLSDIHNANGRGQFSCYPGTITRVMCIPNDHSVLALPMQIPEFIIYRVRQLLVSRITDYFSTDLRDATYIELKETYLALLTFSTFNSTDIIDNTLRSVMGCSLNRLLSSWDEFVRAAFWGDIEGALAQIILNVEMEYNSHELNNLEFAILNHGLLDISMYTANAIRSVFLGALSAEDRLTFEAEERESNEELFRYDASDSESRIFAIYSQLANNIVRTQAEAHREEDDDRIDDENYTHYIETVFTPVVDSICAMDAHSDLSRDQVIAEIRDNRLTGRYQANVALSLNLRARMQASQQDGAQDLSAAFSDDNISRRALSGISDSFDSLWYRCNRDLASEVNAEEVTDYVVGNETIAQAAQRLCLQQRFIHVFHVREPNVVPNSRGTIANSTASGAISEHTRQRSGLSLYETTNEIRIEEIVNTLDRSYHRITNTENVQPYSSMISIPSGIPALLPYHPTGSDVTALSRHGVTNIYVACNLEIPRSTGASSGYLGVLQEICERYSLDTDIRNYEVSCAFVIQDFVFDGTESLLARAHPWLHSDAPERGRYVSVSNIHVASIIDNNVNLLSLGARSEVNTHGGTGAASVVYSPNNLSVFSPGETGPLRNNQVITTIYIDTNYTTADGGVQPRIKIVTTHIVDVSTRLNLEMAIGEINRNRTSGALGDSFAEHIGELNARVRELNLLRNLPLETVGRAVFARPRTSPIPIRPRVPFSNSVRNSAMAMARSSAIRNVAMTQNYILDAAITSPELLTEELSPLANTLLLLESVSIINYSRLSNIDNVDTYSQLALPRAPMLHPYHPAGSPSTIRCDSGITRILASVQLNVDASHYPGFTNMLSHCPIGADLSTAEVDSYVIVQNCPFRNSQLLGRAHSWLHADAPDSQAGFSRDHIMQFMIIEGARASIYPNSRVYTHQEGGNVVYSPNNVNAIDIGADGIIENRFITTVCCVIDSGVPRFAITTHVLLTDDSAVDFTAVIAERAAAPVSLLQFGEFLETIAGFDSEVHLPWNMLSRAAVSIPIEPEPGDNNLAAIDSRIVSVTVTPDYSQESRLISVPGSSPSIPGIVNRISRGIGRARVIANLETSNSSVPVGESSSPVRLSINPVAGHQYPWPERPIGLPSLNQLMGLRAILRARNSLNNTSEGVINPRVVNNSNLNGSIHEVEEHLVELELVQLRERTSVLTNMQVGPTYRYNDNMVSLIPVFTNEISRPVLPVISISYGNHIDRGRLPRHINRQLRIILGDDVPNSIMVNFCLQEGDTGLPLRLSMSQAMGTADANEFSYIVGIMSTSPSYFEQFNINAGELEAEDRQINIPDGHESFYSCIFVHETNQLFITAHAIVPPAFCQRIRGGLSGYIEDPITRGRNNFAPHNLEELSLWMNSNLRTSGEAAEAGVAALEIYSELNNCIRHRIAVRVDDSDMRMFNGSRDFEIAYILTNVNNVHYESRHMPIAPIISRASVLNSGHESLHAPICLSHRITNDSMLPAHIIRILARHNLEVNTNADLDVFFVAQENNYRRGENMLLTASSIVETSCAQLFENPSASVEGICIISPDRNGRDGHEIHTEIFNSNNNVRFNVVGTPGDSCFQSIIILRSAVNGVNSRVLWTMHNLLSENDLTILNNSIQSRIFSVIPGTEITTLEQVMSCALRCSALQNIYNFESVVRGGTDFPNIDLGADIRFDNVGPEIYTHEQICRLSNGSGEQLHELWLDVDAHRQAFIEFYVRATPGLEIISNAITSIIASGGEEYDIFNAEVIENCIRYNNHNVLELLRLNSINLHVLINGVSINGENPLLLCTLLRHRECAIEILLSGQPNILNLYGEREHRWCIANNLEEEYELIIRSYEFRVGLRSPSSSNGEARVAPSRDTVIAVNLEDLTSSDHYDRMMRNLFRYIREGDIESFRTTFNMSSSHFLDRVCLGNTLMTYCVSQDQWAIMRLLVDEGGANIDMARPVDGMTPLHVAADCGYTYIIEYILSISAASRDTEDGEGRTALEILLQREYGDENDARALFIIDEEIEPSARARSRSPSFT